MVHKLELEIELEVKEELKRADIYEKIKNRLLNERKTPMIGDLINLET